MLSSAPWSSTSGPVLPGSAMDTQVPVGEVPGMRDVPGRPRNPQLCHSDSSGWWHMYVHNIHMAQIKSRGGRAKQFSNKQSK